MSDDEQQAVQSESVPEIHVVPDPPPVTCNGCLSEAERNKELAAQVKELTEKNAQLEKQAQFIAARFRNAVLKLGLAYLDA